MVRPRPLAGGILSQSWQAQALELEARLAASRATWKLVVGHHPIWNNHFNHTQELVDSIQPLLERCAPCMHCAPGLRVMCMGASMALALLPSGRRGEPSSNAVEALPGLVQPNCRAAHSITGCQRVPR